MRIAAIDNHSVYFRANFAKDDQTVNILKQNAQSNPQDTYNAIRVLEKVDTQDVISISERSVNPNTQITSFKNENTGKSIDIIYDKLSKSAFVGQKSKMSKKYGGVLNAFVQILVSSDKKTPKEERAFDELFDESVDFVNDEDLKFNRYINELSLMSGAKKYEQMAQDNHDDVIKYTDLAEKSRAEIIKNLNTAQKVKSRYITLNLIGHI